MSLLNRIKQLCEQNSHSLASLEREAGIGQGTIRRWDNNVPSVEKLLAVANVLNTSVDYLLTGKDSVSGEQDKGKLIDCTGLNDLGIKKVQEYINDLMENPKYTEKPIISESMSKTIAAADSFTTVTKQK